jgi:hypothetical protein
LNLTEKGRFLSTNEGSFEPALDRTLRRLGQKISFAPNRFRGKCPEIDLFIYT